MIQPQELRIGNYVSDLDGNILEIKLIASKEVLTKRDSLKRIGGNFLIESINPIPLTEENFLKFINWGFEEGFNIKRQSNEFWEETCYLMENIIDGSGNFEVCFSKSKSINDVEVSYWIDNERLEFMLSDDLHNFQNLFFITTGQELPLKIKP